MVKTHFFQTFLSDRLGIHTDLEYDRVGLANQTPHGFGQYKSLKKHRKSVNKMGLSRKRREKWGLATNSALPYYTTVRECLIEPCTGIGTRNRALAFVLFLATSVARLTISFFQPAYQAHMTTLATLYNLKYWKSIVR